MPLRLSRCSFKSLLFFVSRWNRAILAVSSPCGTLQNCCLQFLVLAPLTPKFTPLNLHLHKIACKSACMADRPEMFAPTRGFWGWPIQWNHAKCCGADPCCHGNDICARRGVYIIAYRLVLWNIIM